MVSAYGFPGVREGWSKNGPLVPCPEEMCRGGQELHLWVPGKTPQSQVCILNMLMNLVCNELIRDRPGTRVGSGEIVRWLDGLGTKVWPVSQVVLRTQRR